MDKVDLTPAKLADIKKKAEGCDSKYWVMDQQGDVMAVDFDSEGTQPKVASVEFLEDAEFIAAADPATVLALVEEIERLRALRCWVIMRKDNRDQVFDGPFFSEEDARLHVPDSLDYEYTVEPWVNQANVKESEATQ